LIDCIGVQEREMEHVDLAIRVKPPKFGPNDAMKI